MGTGRGKARRARASSEEVIFDPERIFQTLINYEVRFVVIGMFAATMQGARGVTEDVDVTPEKSVKNLDKLCEALLSLDAVVVDEEGEMLPDAPLDEQHLSIWQVTHLQTSAGNIDIVLDPAAAHGYPDLARDSHPQTIPSGEKVLVVSLERIIQSKRASNRDKDRRTIPNLENLLREREEGV